MTEKMLYETKDVSALLGKSPRTLSRWIREGLFPPGRIHAGRRKWTAQELEKWKKEFDKVL